MYMLYIWLTVFVVGLLVEIITDGSLVSLWFSLGAVIPFFMSLSKNTAVGFVIAEIVIFGVVTALCLIFLRKLAKRLLYKKTERTNIDALVGLKLKVVSVDEEKTSAVVKINGIEYTAVGENDETFEVKETVEVVKFKGNKVIIKKKGE